MSDQSTDPAPTAADPPRTPEVSTGVQTSLDAGPVAASAPTQETILPSGDTVVVSLDPMGAPIEVVEVIEGATTPASLVATPMPSAEYGYRPEPIPGPSVEEIKMMSVEGFPAQKSAQELIMARAQAQADAIVKAATDAVAAMDEAEAAAAAAAESG